MKKRWLLLIPLLAGCGSTLEPNYFNGNYYMAGDSDCKFMRAAQANVIQCFDAQDKPTIQRRALTTEELMFSRQSKMQASSGSVGSMPVVRYPTMGTPQVTPLSQGGDQVRCVTAGIYMNCR